MISPFDWRVVENDNGMYQNNHLTMENQELNENSIYTETIRRFFEEDQGRSYNINLNFETDLLFMNFSVYQSNIQFFVFFFASILCLASDMYVQSLRGSKYWYLNPTTTKVTVVFIINCLLWLDFILESQAKRIRNSYSGIIIYNNFPIQYTI